MVTGWSCRTLCRHAPEERRKRMNKKQLLTFSATFLRTIEVKLFNIQMQLGSVITTWSVQNCSSLHSKINPQQTGDLEVSSSPLQYCSHL